MTVLCAIPIQIPVHRIRVQAKCLATGGPVHTAVLRLADYWGDSAEEIAEVLGLPIPRVEQLLVDLANGGEPIEREFVLWVDHARERVLPYSALTGVAIKPERNGPLTLPADPPTPATLTHMGLDAGVSWDLGAAGHAQVIEIDHMQADIRDRNLPHVLRLPDTQLLISSADPASERYDFKVAQHGTIDPQITAWTRANHQDALETFVDDGELGAGEALIEQLAEIARHGNWQTLEPHPGSLRERIADMAERAERRLAVAAPDLRHIPTWLSQTLTDAAEREVQIVLSPVRAGFAPKRADFPFQTTPAPKQDGALTLIADEQAAILHSDAPACLDRPASPVRQHMHATRDRAAVAWLLDKLTLAPLHPRAPRRPLTKTTIAAMLRQALADLQGELPPGLHATINAEDEQFALDMLARHTATAGPDTAGAQMANTPTAAARRIAAGIGWERIVMTRISALAAERTSLRVFAERWHPEGARIDIDLIVTDKAKRVTWAIDAKNSTPTAEQLGKMQAQLRLLKTHSSLRRKHQAIGLIVHRATQLDPPIQPTEHPAVIRTTLQRLPDLLLAHRLPGECPRRTAC